MTRATLEVIQRVTAALSAAEAPAMATRRPGLSAQAVRGIVARLHPPLAELIDETIEAWWAWQNGIDPAVPSADIARARIAPDDLVLVELDGLIEDYLDRLQGHVPARPTFPLSIDDGGQFRCLVRVDADSPWTLWGLPVDAEDWLPLEATGGAPSPPAFADYLVALADGLESGRLGVGPHGDVIRLGVGDRYGPYPWPAAAESR